jgi:hypothetical protein
MAPGGTNATPPNHCPTQPDSALKSHSQEWNFGESRTSGARIPREGGGKRTASGTNQRPYYGMGRSGQIGGGGKRGVLM